ncbi:MAG: amidohydrolase [Pseudomonadota bacterium]
MKICIWASLTGLLLWACLAQGATQVLLSNHVIPMTKPHQKQGLPMAIVVQDGLIQWMGEKSDLPIFLQEHPEQSVQSIDLGDQAVLPGFIDAHGHATFTALGTQLANVASPPVGPSRDIGDLQTALRLYIAEKQIQPGEWVVGMGYDDSLLTQRRHPNRDDLDQVSVDHPIMLMHVSGHLATANSKALARIGYSSETPDPPGGHIRRRPDSREPNGVLEESATGPLRRYMQAANRNPVASVREAIKVYASHGITTIQDGAASPEVIALLQAAAVQGALTVDVIAYPWGMVQPDQIIKGYEYGRYNAGLKIGGVKLSLDGSPQGKTAYLSEPYHVPPHGQTPAYRGYPSVSEAVAHDLIEKYLDAQIPIIVHANGDAAAQVLIDGVAAARPQHDHRTVMIHAQTVREDQLTRMKGLRMIPSYFSAHTFYWGDWHRDSVLGPERGARISPTASTVSRGMPFTVHNDAPIVPPDMIRLLWATTNRLTRSGKILGKEQRISTYQALLAMTYYAAYQSFEETTKGSLEVGKRADFVVLSNDPLTTPIDRLLDLRVTHTFVTGQLVYTAPTE